jgi:hypothetical protein
MPRTSARSSSERIERSGLEEPHVVADAQRLLVRHRERERLGELGHRAQQPRLAVLEGQDVVLGQRQQRQAVLGRAARPAAPVEAVEEPAADDTGEGGLLDGGFGEGGHGGASRCRARCSGFSR